MPPPLKQIQPIIAFAAVHLDQDVSLTTLARRAGYSTYHLHRLFLAATGETPKQFTLRLRLSSAAAMLLTTRDSAFNVALACGFESHESFCRAFRRQFQMAPSEYRARALLSAADPIQHAAIVRELAPCIGLYLYALTTAPPEKKAMPYSITKRQIAPQPVLVVRRRMKPSELAATLAQVLGAVFQHAQQNGIAIAGQPFTRFIECPPGLWTIEAGLPIARPIDNVASFPDSEVRHDVLPGGFVAITTHTGPYDQLPEAHAAVQQWIDAEGLRLAGLPWEIYTTDPADVPDPKDWKTEIFWPIDSPPQS